ncbi:MAG: tRNA pseudouridine(38-40) synthase TruA [Candidatus Nanopelagicus sp.]|jgi:tRNA pseudouridine38-40 synthase
MTKPTLEVKSGFSRLRVDLTYDGSDFSGWAKQPGLRTVQEEFETALATLTRSEISTIIAGRTDAGVHAKHQVLHVDLPKDIDVENLAFRLNQLLKKDVRVISAGWAPPHFHARFGPISRSYEYKIIDGGKITAPLDRHDSVEWFRTLDVDLMNQAGRLLIGEHDFFAFCKHRPGTSTVKNLFNFTWQRDNDGVVIGEITANSFGYNMVRNLVGAAVCVGEGRFKPEWMLKTLRDKVRISDSYVFPAKGLSLVKVEFPPVEQYLAHYNSYQPTSAELEDEG